ncbi:MAG: cob(I)yrinic acid a,c-diamide adenosyltransferase [Bdellovibrionales bacterium]|nr:cob(I)yrinic acid a,c-diamide adenosyltransferase [Bdellovibrionales bacterium]
MVKLNKIYTRNGDKGLTQLVGGTPISKHSPRVHAYGEVDELNAALGIVRTLFDGHNQKETCYKILTKVQNELFDMGSILATDPTQAWEGMPEISKSHLEQLEGWIDTLNKDLPELNSFVLPGGTQANSFIHLARTICRRAERSISSLSATEPVPANILIYLNRLSDLLFVMARWEVKQEQKDEYLWVPGGTAKVS